MKNCSQLKQRRLFPLMLAAAFMLVGLVPAVASAQSTEKLTRYLPSSSQLVVGLNFSKLSKSKYYKEALTWARANAGADQDFLKILEEDASLDLSKDIESVVLSIPDTQVNSSKPQRNFTVAVSGSFDNDKLLAAIKKKNADLKETKKGKAAVYSKEEFEFTFPKKGVLWVTAGPDKYRKDALKTLAEAKHSVQANKVFKKLMGEVKTSQGFWMMGDTSKIKAGQTNGAPQPKSIAVSADISKGLVLDLLAELPTEADAKSAVKQMDALKQQGSQAAMLSIMGAGPLVANLTTKHDGTKLVASTTMTATEFDTMVQRLKQLAQSQMQGGTMPTPSQPVPNKDSKSKSDGANADFN